MEAFLSTVYQSIPVINRRGLQDPPVTGISYDSRSVKPGHIFFALDGLHVDGHAYIMQAIDRGAVAIVHRKPLESYRDGIVYLQVDNPRTSLSPAAAALWGNPSQKIRVCGVTGTDGKSTTVSLIHQLLEASGNKSGYLSTVQVKAGNEVIKNPFRQSTPEASEIQHFLREMVNNGFTSAVIESTSHGLSEKNNRLGDVAFDVAVMTNITHEHLEFHGTFEQYRSDKTNLFRSLSKFGKSGHAVINADDPSAKWIADETAASTPAGANIPCISTYSTQDESATIWSRILSITPTGTRVRFTYRNTESGEIFIPLPGAFNVRNVMAALLAVSVLTGKPLEEFYPLVSGLRGVPGRWVIVDCGQPFPVIIDYAHTPGAFEQVFPTFRETTRGRLIAVFGSAGERDVIKRSWQGRIADRFADIIILTDEDPRGDDPMEILEGIAEGCTGVRTPRVREENLFLIPDRALALRKAFSLARRDDTVVLLGKGHESTILYASGPRPWDEHREAEIALLETGWKRH